MTLTGILPIIKPVSLRSSFCVSEVKKKLGNTVKVGHGGTLDSTASGVLVLLLGNATRLSNYIMEMPKAYEVIVQLGSETTSDDATGEILSEKKWEHITTKEIDIALYAFTGWRLQVPPNYSAVHINGQRAHNLARSGIKMNILPKPVFIFRLRRTSNIEKNGQVVFQIHCNKGTYIRSFARDLGRYLGTAAHVNSLKRTSVGGFNEIQSVDFNEILKMRSCDEILKKVFYLDKFINLTPSYDADKDSFNKLKNGLSIHISQIKRTKLPETYLSKSEVIFVNFRTNISICRTKQKEGYYTLHPVTNILCKGNH